MNEDIEILDDFSENQSQVSEPQAPQMNQSSNSFERMVNETPAEPVKEPAYANSYPNDFNNSFDNSYNNGNNYNNNYNGNNYGNSYNNNYNNQVDVNYQNNNEVLQPTDNQDLTITAVYPNGFAVEEPQELENTQVIKPRKKNKTDLYLIIIVGVLAVTLVVLLVMFYL